MRYFLAITLVMSAALVEVAGAAPVTETWTAGAGTSNWNTTTNWAGGTVPGLVSLQGDTATFNASTATKPNLDITGNVAYLNQITFTSTSITQITNNPGTSITFQGFGATAPKITATGTGPGTITIYPPIVLQETLTITNSDDTRNHILELGSFTESGGSFGLVINGLACTTLTGTSTYTGSTTIAPASGTEAIVRAGSTGALSPYSDFTVTSPGQLDLDGKDNTIKSLSGTGSVLAASAATLTITNGGSSSLAISGSLGLTLTGGTFTLNADTAYTGNTTLTGNAHLVAGSSGVLSENSPLILQDSSQLTLGTDNTVKGLNGGVDTRINITAGTLSVESNGGTYNGIIEGAGALALLTAGTLTLSGVNTYTGGTTVPESTTLALAGGGQISTTGTLSITGTGAFNISGVTTGATIGTVSVAVSTGTIVLGSKTLTIAMGADSSIAGNISGVGGSLIVSGAHQLSLGGINSYTGSTTIGSGSTVAATASTTAFAAASAFTVNGTLDLKGQNNTIGSLAGSGVIQSTGGASTLTIASGGSFSGTLINGTAGTLGLTLSSGTLTLTGANTYTGTTTITSGTLALGAGGSLAGTPFTDVVANGTFDISGSANQNIKNLTGNGTVQLGNNTLTLNASGTPTYGGTIHGVGGITYVGGAVIFTLSATGSDYTGATTVTSGTFQAGIANAFSADSAFAVAGTLDLGGFNNTIKSLSGNGTVQSTGGTGTLTITNGGSFSGIIQNGTGGTLALTLTGGTLALTGANTYTGATNVIGATLSYGVDSTFSESTSITLSNGATLLNAGSFTNTIASLTSDSTSVANLGSGGTLTLKSGGGNFQGVISGAGNIALTTAGTLTLSNGSNTFSGTLSVGIGTTLALTGAGTIASASSATIDGILNISGITGAATVQDLSGAGTGALVLGSRELDITLTVNKEFAGDITGSSGAYLGIDGAFTFTLSGDNSGYSGETGILAGSTLAAGSITALSPNSDFIIDGTLDLVTFSNSVKSLSGDTAGKVDLGDNPGPPLSSAQLTITNGGGNIFSGVIQGSSTGGVTLIEGTQILAGTNTYTGPTVIEAGGILQVTGSLSASTSVTADGTFDISGGVGQAIANLNSSNPGGTVNLGNNRLTITPTQNNSYYGTLHGVGGAVTYDGGVTPFILTLEVSGGPSSDYSGTTLIASGTFRAGGSNVFSPLSAYVVTGTLDLNNSSNTIRALTGAGTISLGSGTLTITAGGAYSGAITGTGGSVVLTGGTLALTGAAKAYTGSTTVNAATLSYGAADATPNASAISLVNGATLLNTGSFSTEVLSITGDSTSFLNLGSGGTFTVKGGGIFQGVISGAGNVALTTAGTLTLSNGSNTFSGTLSVGAGTILALTGAGTVSDASSVSVDGTLDISGITGTATISNLSGAGAITLGARELDILQSGDATFSGTISGSGGSLGLIGGANLLLSGTNTYSGSTTIIQGATLTAGSISSLSPSDFSVGGTVSLVTFSNTIKSLSGTATGSVLLGSGTLTITNGGDFAGGITGTGGVTLTGGTLTLTGANGYTGTTTITSGTLALGAGGSLAPTPFTDVVANGTFDISGSANQNIKNLTGNGTVQLGNNTLTLNASGTPTYGGTIHGVGGITYVGGAVTFVLSATGSDYTGTTTVTSGTIQAGIANAFSPNSAFAVAGKLDLNDFANTIKGLSGAGTVDLGSGTLTITNGGTFSGNITGTGGAVNLTGGILTLSGGNVNDYTGATTVSNGATLASGALGSLPTASVITLEDSSQMTLATDNSILTLNGDTDSGVVISANTLTITTGGTFAGIISGAGNLENSGGTLTLSNANIFTGALNSSGGILRLTGLGSVVDASSVTINGTSFSISGISSSATTVNNLNGDAAIALGDKTLNIINGGAIRVLSGNISGEGGSLSFSGGVQVNLSGNNTYSGSTTVGATITVGAGVSSGFSPNSAFTVNGILDLQLSSNTIYSLSGASTGIVQSTGATTARVLTITNGGNFSGIIRDSLNPQTGTLGITLSGGTLVLSGVNTYSGATTIADGATLSAGVASALSAASAMTVTGTLLLNNRPNGVASLTGVGVINTGTSTAQGILTISNGSSLTFSGGITGLGGITLTTGSLTLGTAVSANTYTGPTTINGGSLIAGAANAFAPGSDYTVTGTLSLVSYNNTIKSLSGAGTVSLGSGTLTINNGGSFSGAIGGSGGITLVDASLAFASGTLTLSGSSNTYSGATTITDGTLTISADGALSPNTAVTIETGATLAITGTSAASAVSVSNSGTLSTVLPLTLSTTYTQTSGGSLGLTYNTGATTGKILATTGITIDGTLNVTKGTGAESGIHVLLSTSGVGSTVSGTFSTFNPTGFTATPFLAYSLQSVKMFFAGCENTWDYPGDGNWSESTNWASDGCVPGVSGNTDDVANFVTLAQTAITVTLANAAGTAAQALTLFELNMTGSTEYTLSQYSTASTITLDGSGVGVVPTININGGNHRIDAPIIVNDSSELFLVDGTSLTFNSNTTLTSLSTQTFTIAQSAGSTTGSGTLTNNGTLTPYGLLVVSATVENETSIIPTNSLTLAGASGKTAIILNSGTNAKIETSASSGTVQIGGAGTTYVTNSGIGAHVGPTGIDSTMVIGSTGTTIITNNGNGAVFGPTGSGGDLTVSGAGTTTITNTGSGVKFGATGAAGNVTISAGSITNSSGAIIQAGSGGVLTISGGSITNDRTSTVGTTASDLTFTSGTLNTSGNVVAFNYTQSGSATLQLNLINAPTVLGNVAASGTATVGGTLVVNALSGSVTSNQTVDLITTERGVIGTYDTVTYTNFPVGVIPQIVYLPHVVELVTSNTVTEQSVGSLSEFAFNVVNQANILMQRDIHDLNIRVRKRNQFGRQTSSYTPPSSSAPAPASISPPTPALQSEVSFVEEEGAEPQIVKVASQRTRREQHYLAERELEKAPNPSRFYFGPVDSFGTFNTKSTSQTGFGFNSVGIYTGFDHAFDNFGVGVVSEYLYTGADIASNSGSFRINQIQGSVYGTWLPPALPELSLNGIIGYGYSWIGMNRIAGYGGSTANVLANIQGMQADGLFGVEYFFSHRQFESMPENVYVTPLLNLQYIWSRIGKFDEEFAGAYHLHVGQQGAQSLKTTLATRFEYMFNRSYYTCKSEFDLGWQFEFLDGDRNVHLSTINWPQVQSISEGVVGAGCNTVWIGLDILFTVYKVFELEMSYDLQWNELYINNTFYLGIGGNF